MQLMECIQKQLVNNASSYLYVDNQLIWLSSIIIIIIIVVAITIGTPPPSPPSSSSLATAAAAVRPAEVIAAIYSGSFTITTGNRERKKDEAVGERTRL